MQPNDSLFPSHHPPFDVNPITIQYLPPYSRSITSNPPSISPRRVVIASSSSSQTQLVPEPQEISVFSVPLHELLHQPRQLSRH
ncbi:hypothetical protein BDP27DRAFT_325654 [Rhodocollybia butyracea]|uniref:Uncharacterized protein n=1 Tax=Rhodocollybia butyracea TaxID=206335 RepID=A0A9P5PFA1_9AGAR|nr:hypothetical protein BDP27DRAFT_325654 [Rhodocollybia butyracea]